MMLGARKYTVPEDALLFRPREMKETRRGFGDALYELGKSNPRIVALAADLAESVRMDKFFKAFPERFFQCGVAEANMVGVAAGLATSGFIPFAGSFANFITGRVFDQIRQSICYSRKNVKLAGSHAGLTLGEDGASHQILEDIALMKSLPFMTIFNPCDYWQTYQATFAAAEIDGPVYLRFGRPKWPQFLPENLPFEPGKALILKRGKDVSLFATGHMVWVAIQAEAVLRTYFGVDVELINLHTLKPLDEEAILESASRTRAVVTCEEHQRLGGMGESIAGILTEKCPVHQEFVAVRDRFGQSGKPRELLEEYNLWVDDVVDAVLNVLRKTGKY